MLKYKDTKTWLTGILLVSSVATPGIARSYESCGRASGIVKPNSIGYSLTSMASENRLTRLSNHVEEVVDQSNSGERTSSSEGMRRCFAEGSSLERSEFKRVMRTAAESSSEIAKYVRDNWDGASSATLANSRRFSNTVKQINEDFAEKLIYNHPDSNGNKICAFNKHIVFVNKMIRCTNSETLQPVEKDLMRVIYGLEVNVRGVSEEGRLTPRSTDYRNPRNYRDTDRDTDRYTTDTDSSDDEGFFQRSYRWLNDNYEHPSDTAARRRDSDYGRKWGSSNPNSIYYRSNQ